MLFRLCGLSLLAALAPLEAQDPFAACERDLAALPPEEDGTRCYFDTASDPASYRRAAERLSALRDAYPDRPWLRHWLAQTHRLGQPDSAAVPSLYEDAVTAFRSHDLAVGESMALDGLRAWFNGLQRFEEAREQVDRLSERFGAAREPILRFRVLRIEGTQLYIEGRNFGIARAKLDEAIEVGDRAFDYPRTLDPWYVGNRRTLLHYLVNLSLLLGDFEEAGERWEQSLETIRASGQDTPPELYQAQSLILSGLYLESPSPALRDQALDTARKTSELARRSGRPQAQATADSNLGRLLGWPTGVPHLESCVERSADHLLRLLESECDINLALLVAEDDPERANQLRERALDAARESADPDRAEAYVHAVGAYLNWRLLPENEAIAGFEDSLRPIEALRRKQDTWRGRAAWFTTWADHYQIFVGHLLRSHQASASPETLARAFRVSETMRSRVLHDTLLAADDTLPELTEDFTSLAEARSLLAADEALLVFQAAPDENIYGHFQGGSWVIAVTRDATLVQPLPQAFALGRRLPTLRGLLARRDDGAHKALATYYRSLLDPVLGQLPATVRHLILVADGDLHNVPWAALRTDPENRPLIERYALSRIPSVTLWARWRQARSPDETRRPALVLADPDLPTAALGGEDGRRSQLDAPGSLPRAREEGRRLARHLDGVDLHHGPDASESLVRRLDLTRYRMLHFAAHARANHEDPENSALYLAAGSDTDGLLRFGEIVDLDMAGCLVVLSACDTAAGRVLRGEGVLDLARAFFQAGAHAVAASLWPLRDDEAMELVDGLYRHLARGETLSGALAAAQRERIEAGDPADAWAGLVVIGDGAVVPFPGGRRGTFRWPTRVGVGLSLLVLVGIGWVAWRGRRSSAREAGDSVET